MHVDGVLATMWTSSGTTGAFEKIDLPAGTSGAVVEITGVLADEEWLSIVEVSLSGHWRTSQSHASKSVPVTLFPCGGTVERTERFEGVKIVDQYRQISFGAHFRTACTLRPPAYATTIIA